MVKVNTIQIWLLATALLFTANTYAAEYFFNIGALSYDAEYLVGDPSIDDKSYTGNAIVATVGIRNLVGRNQKHAIGFGIDTYEVEDQRLIGYRAIDYQYLFNQLFRAGAFVGAASLDSGLPQNGYYMGVNISLTDVVFNTDIMLEIRNGNGLARDRKLEEDPDGIKPDIFLDYVAVALALNWRF